MRKKQVLTGIVSILVIATSTKTVVGATVGISLLNGAIATIALYALVFIRERWNRRSAAR